MALSFGQIATVADSLGLDPCAVKAVIEVESSGSGFLPDGRVKILFEGHIFWRELLSRNLEPAIYHRKHPTLVYPKWTKIYYSKNPADEWERLDAAMRINKEAALCSASWGLFQIMGFNYAASGFPSVEAFVAGQEKGEEEQLKLFCEFIRTEKILPYLVRKDWPGFARRYNGPGYAKNKYDTKLAAAYAKCKNEGGWK